MSAALEDTPTVVTFKAHPFYMQATQVLIAELIYVLSVV
jgi:hypothetical protein